MNIFDDLEVDGTVFESD